jgi:hypothetical protein
MILARRRYRCLTPKSVTLQTTNPRYFRCWFFPRPQCFTRCFQIGRVHHGPQRSHGHGVLFDDQSNSPVLRLARKLDRNQRSILKPMPLNRQFLRVPNQRSPPETCNGCHTTAFPAFRFPVNRLQNCRTEQSASKLEGSSMHTTKKTCLPPNACGKTNTSRKAHALARTTDSQEVRSDLRRHSTQASLP